MPLSELLQAMDADAQRELESALAVQQRRATQILDDAHADAARVVATGVAEAEGRAAAEAAQVRADAVAASRRRLEQAVTDGLRAVEEEVERRLQDLRGTEAGTAATLRLLAEARRILPSASWAQVPAGDVEAAQTAAPDLSVTGDLPGVGAVVGDDGGRAVDNSAATRWANLWPDCRAEVSLAWRS